MNPNMNYVTMLTLHCFPAADAGWVATAHAGLAGCWSPYCWALPDLV